MPEFEYTYKCVADDVTDFPFHSIVPATLAPGDRAISSRQIKHPHLKLVARRPLKAETSKRRPSGRTSKPTPARPEPEKVVQEPTEHPAPAPKEVPATAPREVR